MKKRITVYMAVVSSYNGVCGNSIDFAYCFPTEKERMQWVNDCGDGQDIGFFEDEMEVEL